MQRAKRPNARREPGRYQANRPERSYEKCKIFSKKGLTGYARYAKILITCEKGLFCYAFFRFSHGEKGRFQICREAVGIPGKPVMILIIRRCR